MATAVTINKVKTYPETGYVASWIGLADDEEGDAVTLIGYSDRSVQVTGTFGSSGSVQLEGSNDGTTFVLLTDNLGNNLTFTAAGLKGVGPLAAYIRPRVTVGDGTTDLDVHILVSGVVHGR